MIKIKKSMQSKTIRVLYRISLKELKKFSKHLSQYTHLNKLEELVTYLTKYHPNVDHRNLNRANLFKQIYKNESLNENKINLLLSDVLRQFKNYLGLMEFNEHPQLNEIFQLSKILELDLQDELIKLTDVVLEKKRLDHFTEDALKYGFELDLLNSARFTLDYVKRNKDWPLQNANDQLDAYYLLQKLIIGSEMLNRARIFEIHYDVTSTDNLIAYFRSNEKGYFDNIYIKIYYHIYKLYKHESSEALLDNLYEDLKEHGNRLTSGELYEVFVKIKNYCIDKTLQGNDLYWPLGFKFIQLQIEMNAFLLNNSISHIEYRNTVNFALRSGEMSWALSFLETFKKYLNKKHRSNAYQCNYASILFYQGDYSGALKVLSLVKFIKSEDSFYGLFVRSISLKILYELKELNTFQSSILSFRNYLSRNKELAEVQIEFYRNFVNVIHRLFLLEFKSPTMMKKTLGNKLDELEIEMANSKLLLNRSWLINKLSDLRSK